MFVELLLTLQVNENDNDDNNDNNPIYPRHESIQTTENEIKIDIPPSVPEDVLYNGNSVFLICRTNSG